MASSALNKERDDTIFADVFHYNPDSLEVISRPKYYYPLSKHFRDHESNNIHDVNITQWFDMVSTIRHILVYNRQVVSGYLLDYVDLHNANERLIASSCERNLKANTNLNNYEYGFRHY